MHVLKFGGSSVADATNISKVLDIVSDVAAKDRVILVCSAIKGCTDTLINEGPAPKLGDRHRNIIKRLFTGKEREEAVAEFDREFNALTADTPGLEAYGEIFSTRIIARKLACDGINALWIDSRDLIKAENCKLIEELSYPRIKATVEAHPEVKVFVAPGFICTDRKGRVGNLGRGGSDYSAAIYAAGCNDARLEIWTDVPGIMTANPKDVPSARTIPDISYEAALNLANYGAKVLYPPTISPAMKAGIAINIRNTFNPSHPGTTISSNAAGDVPEWMGVTSCSKGEDSILHLVGEGKVKLQTAVDRIGTALGKAGVRIIEKGIEDGSVFALVHKEQEKEALAAIHKEFFELNATSVTEVYIAGFGAVGKALVSLIGESSASVAERTGKKLKICGIADSRRFTVDREGILPENVEYILNQSGETGNFVDTVVAAASRGAVFVDCSNSETLHESYGTLFRNGISVVTSNRRALAIPYAKYASLKSEALENGVSFRYETTVGAAIPVLESFSSGAVNADSLQSIEAVISCTMNNIITGYDGANTESFATLLKKAQDNGLTEKDPRMDLGGQDALRKILIIAREAGIPLEESDVEVKPMLGEEFFNCSLEEFYQLLQENEPEFIEREKQLDDLGKRQRFVASVVRDPEAPLGFKASIKMQLVGIDSTFYWISGSENVISIRSDFFSSPLVLKGSGEGAKFAASGIINDILA